MLSKPYLYVYWYVVLPGLLLALTRTPSFKSGYFGLAYQDHRLDGYEIDQLNVPGPIECSRACITNSNCQSYNFGDTADINGLHTCQLSDMSVGSSTTLDLVETPGFSYYEEPQIMKGLRCRQGLCQNGGTCVEIQGSFANCKCAAFYTGRYCDNSEAKDCHDIFAKGGTIDGIYPINPDSNGIIHVYCDQTSVIGGGWIVLQRRFSPFNTSFYRNWTAYKTGFGDLTNEFWLGNEAIHRITKTPRTLLIKLKTSDQRYGKSSYLNFQVSSEDKNYLMDYSKLNTITRDFGDALQGQKGTMFSTDDRNNVALGKSYVNCAQNKQSAWWYSNICGASDLNQKSYPLWDTWPYFAQVSKSTMKVK